jgi:hypothetical protein
VFNVISKSLLLCLISILKVGVVCGGKVLVGTSHTQYTGGHGCAGGQDGCCTCGGCCGQITCGGGCGHCTGGGRGGHWT